LLDWLPLPNDAPSQTSRLTTPPADWQDWLAALFPDYVQHGFATHHQEFWAWVWAVQTGQRPRPFVAIWPRGGAKSTSAELACAALGARTQRHYALYICATQDQADDHVQNVAALLEADTLARYYPTLADRAVGKFGNAKGWRRNRLRTAHGFTVDALGLDTAARGVKLEEQRPDLIVFDDLDGEHDTAATTEKKINTITKKLLPAGSADAAILAIQNLVLPDGIFAQLADGRADWLSDRITSGPHPALRDLAYEQRNGKTVLVAGAPTWEGQSLAACQEMVNSMGISAFLSECQHDVRAPAGGMFDHLSFRHCAYTDVPDLVRVAVWCDPAVTSTDQSDANGIQADGISEDDTLYRLWSWEQRSTPENTIKTALLKAVELGADHIGIETDQGGDTWRSVVVVAWQWLVDDDEYPHITDDTERPRFRSATAGAIGPKAHRAAQMLAAYERGEIVHVLGTHATLEAALNRFPKTKPYDLVDAAFWSWRQLSKRKAGLL
jgi:hypothetical protein